MVLWIRMFCLWCLQLVVFSFLGMFILHFREQCAILWMLSLWPFRPELPLLSQPLEGNALPLISLIRNCLISSYFLGFTSWTETFAVRIFKGRPILCTAFRLLFCPKSHWSRENPYKKWLEKLQKFKDPRQNWKRFFSSFWRRLKGMGCSSSFLSHSKSCHTETQLSHTFRKLLTGSLKGESAIALII